MLRHRDYHRDLPGAADVLLLIEVADTTLRYDRDVKVPLYARAGIPEVWLVDLNGGAMIRYADPRDGTYQRIEQFGRGERITATTLPAVTVAVDDIFA